MQMVDLLQQSLVWLLQQSFQELGSAKGVGFTGEAAAALTTSQPEKSLVNL